MENVDWAKIAKIALSFAVFGVFLYRMIRYSRVKKGVLLIDRATKAAQRGNMQQALNLYEQGVALDTPGMEKDDIHCYFSGECLKAGMADKALELAKRAVEHNPKRAKGFLQMAEAHQMLQDFRAAEADYLAAAALEPDNAAVYTGLGTLKIITGKPMEAIVHLKRAVELEPEKGAHYSNLAYSYTMNLDVKNAEKYLKLAKKHGDRDTRAEEQKLAEARSLLAGIDGDLAQFSLDYRQLSDRLDSFAAITAQKAVRLVLKKERCQPKDSFLAGTPWMPAGFSIPLDGSGQAMRLLAQINFRQMPPLDGFPRRGILQFFIAANDIYGLGMDDLAAQADFRIVYHGDDGLLDQIAVPSTDKGSQDFPIDQQMKIAFEETVEPVTITDFRFEALFERHVGVPCDELPDEIADRIHERFDGSGHKIGGYPMFTQEDPRNDNPAYAKYDVLLLQIDSDDKAGILWGDNGVANFFISSSDLAACKFDDVLYTWDCY